MQTKTLLLAGAAALAAVANAHASERSAQAILKSYAEDYAKDRTLTEQTVFGVKVGEEFYTVDVAPAADGKPGKGVVRKGAPKTPTFYFPIDSLDYLRKLDAGEFTALTLMVKEFSTDKTPMDIETMEGFQPSEDFTAKVLPLIFHFWTRGDPEFVRFGPEQTRLSHGANVGVFYYQPGLRSGWFDIRPGQHVNENPKSRVNDFPSMFIMLRGEATARIDGEDFPFREGEMMLVPPGVSHEFLNEGEASAFGFLFMFGEGA